MLSLRWSPCEPQVDSQGIDSRNMVQATLVHPNASSTHNQEMTIHLVGKSTQFGRTRKQYTRGLARVHEWHSAYIRFLQIDLSENIVAEFWRSCQDSIATIEYSIFKRSAPF